MLPLCMSHHQGEHTPNGYVKIKEVKLGFKKITLLSCSESCCFHFYTYIFDVRSP
jgi:hypothetical protein